MRVAALVPAAGRGRRLGNKTPKPFIKILGKPLLVYTLENLNKAGPFHEIIVAVEKGRVRSTEALLKRWGLGSARVVAGGSTRAESVRQAVFSVSDDCELVLVHDAARPAVSARCVRGVIQAAKKSGAAVCALPATATVKLGGPRFGKVFRTLDRRRIYLAQTPQVFGRKKLLERYRLLGKKALTATDEAALFDGSGAAALLVPGEAGNLKITTAEDLRLFRFYLRQK